MPYRSQKLSAEIAPRFRWYKYLVCAVGWALTLGWWGHRWKVVRTNSWKRSAMIEMAGCDAYCSRCGHTYFDAFPTEHQLEMEAWIEGQTTKPGSGKKIQSA